MENRSFGRVAGITFLFMLVLSVVVILGEVAFFRLVLGWTPDIYVATVIFGGISIVQSIKGGIMFQTKQVILPRDIAAEDIEGALAGLSFVPVEETEGYCFRQSTPFNIVTGWPRFIVGDLKLTFRGGQTLASGPSRLVTRLQRKFDSAADGAEDVSIVSA